LLSLASRSACVVLANQRLVAAMLDNVHKVLHLQSEMKQLYIYRVLLLVLMQMMKLTTTCELVQDHASVP